MNTQVFSTTEEAEHTLGELYHAEMLLEVAHKTIWMSEPEGNTPTARMQAILDTIDRAQVQIAAVQTQLQAVIDAEEALTPKVVERVVH